MAADRVPFSMKYLPIFIVPVLALGSCMLFTDYVEGNGDVVVRHYAVDDFNEIEQAGIGRVVVTQGTAGPYPVTAVGESNILERITVGVSGDTLVMEQENGVSLHPTQEPLFLVTLPVCERLVLSGAGDIETDGTIIGGTVRIVLQGSGNIEADVEADSVICVLAGAGDIDLEGNTVAADLSITGAGDIDADDLSTDACDAVITGAGDIFVRVKNTLYAAIYGSGDIVYRADGDLVVYPTVTGAGSVRSR